MNLMKTTVAAVVILLGLSMLAADPALAQGVRVMLTQDGKPAAVIVLPGRTAARSLEQAAADLLVAHIK